MDEKYLADHYGGHNVIGHIHIRQKYFGQTSIGQNDFGRNVVFPFIRLYERIEFGPKIMYNKNEDILYHYTYLTLYYRDML